MSKQQKYDRKLYMKEEERLENNQLMRVLGHLGYTIISTKHDDRYFQFTIRRNRK